MAQHRKDEVEQAIRGAALRVLAEKGYLGASVAEIARAAGFSTGNVYRYFEGKEALFDALFSEELVRTVKRLLRARVAAAREAGDLLSPSPTGPYPLASEAVVRFCVEHRLEVVVLLGRATGSRHERLAGDLVEELAKRAVAHFQAARPGLRVTRALRLNLQRIYRGLVESTVAALATFEDEATIREAMEGYARYHLAGLQALLERS